MESFIDFVTDEKIIEIICKKRAALANSRHKEHFLHNLSANYSIHTTDDKLFQITPPRKTWVKLSYAQRQKNNERITNVAYNKKAISLTIKRDLQKNATAPYLRKLKDFLKEIHTTIASNNHIFESPTIIPVFKKEKECRPISQYKNLADAIILILTNKYLTPIFDKGFYSEALAFRAQRLYHNEERKTNHHDAIQQILDFRQKHDNKDIYVAECDIQKFFDVVNQDIIRKNFHKALNAIKEENPTISFKEIEHIFESFLQSYSFNKNVAPLNDKLCNQKFWNKKKIKNCSFKWVDDNEFIEQGVYDSVEELHCQNLGLPQGGALSGLLVNITLNSVDQSLAQYLTDDDLYIRYCDDMILMSTSKKRCEMLFNIYTNCITLCKLVPHKAKNIEPNEKKTHKKHWESKTKNVYLWDRGDNHSHEWIGFVGYEIRRDGEIRIRKSTLRKEINKQKQVCNKILTIVDKNSQKKNNVPESTKQSKKKILFRPTYSIINNLTIKKLIQKCLNSMSIGYVNLYNYKTASNEMSWINGFRYFHFSTTINKQMKILDHSRNNVLGKASQQLYLNLTPEERNQIRERKEKTREKYKEIVRSILTELCEKKGIQQTTREKQIVIPFLPPSNNSTKNNENVQVTKSIPKQPEQENNIQDDYVQIIYDTHSENCAPEVPPTKNTNQDKIKFTEDDKKFVEQKFANIVEENKDEDKNTSLKETVVLNVIQDYFENLEKGDTSNLSELISTEIRKHRGHFYGAPYSYYYHWNKKGIKQTEQYISTDKLPF